MNSYEIFLSCLLWGIPFGILMWALFLVSRGEIYKADQYIVIAAPKSPEAQEILRKRRDGSYPYSVRIPRSAMPAYWKQYGYDPNVPQFRREWERLHKDNSK